MPGTQRPTQQGGHRVSRATAYSKEQKTEGEANAPLVIFVGFEEHLIAKIFLAKNWKKKLEDRM